METAFNPCATKGRGNTTNNSIGIALMARRNSRILVEAASLNLHILPTRLKENNYYLREGQLVEIFTSKAYDVSSDPSYEEITDSSKLSPDCHMLAIAVVCLPSLTHK